VAGVEQGFNVPVGQSAAVENALRASRGRAGNVVNEVDSKLLTDTERLSLKFTLVVVLSAQRPIGG
jgi:hypothetical protein